MEYVERSVDYKKIILVLLVIGVIGWVVYAQRDRILSYNRAPTQAVAGVETVKQTQSEKTKVIAPQLDIQKKITDIAEQVSNLDVKEVAASSPQLQKVLRDMEGLKNLPSSQAKDACMNICKSL